MASSPPYAERDESKSAKLRNTYSILYSGHIVEQIISASFNENSVCPFNLFHKVFSVICNISANFLFDTPFLNRISFKFLYIYISPFFDLQCIVIYSPIIYIVLLKVNLILPCVVIYYLFL